MKNALNLLTKFVGEKVKQLRADLKLLSDTPEYANIAKKLGPLFSVGSSLKQKVVGLFSKNKSTLTPHKPTPEPEDATRTIPLDVMKQNIAKAAQKATKSSKKWQKKRDLVKAAKGLGQTLGATLSRMASFALGLPFVLAVWWAYQNGDIALIVAVAAVGIGAAIGYWQGILGCVISLVSFGVTAFATPLVVEHFDTLVSNSLGTTGVINQALTYGLTGVGICLMFNLLAISIVKMCSNPEAETAYINRLAGFFLGGIQVAACVLLFVSSFTLIEPLFPTMAELSISTKPVEDLRTAKRLLSAKTAINKSRLRTWATQANLFENVPYLDKLNEMKQTICSVSGPERVRYLMRHPSMQELRSLPNMKLAIQNLAKEKEIVDIMNAKQPFNRTAAVTMLSSEAVLNLIKQPKFLEAADQILRESSEPEAISTTTVYTSSPKQQSQSVE